MENRIWVGFLVAVFPVQALAGQTPKCPAGLDVAEQCGCKDAGDDQGEDEDDDLDEVHLYSDGPNEAVEVLPTLECLPDYYQPGAQIPLFDADGSEAARLLSSTDNSSWNVISDGSASFCLYFEGTDVFQFLDDGEVSGSIAAQFTGVVIIGQQVEFVSRTDFLCGDGEFSDLDGGRSAQGARVWGEPSDPPEDQGQQGEYTLFIPSSD